MRLSSLALAWFLCAGGGAVAANAPLLESGTHCVAYRAEKVLLYFSKAEVIGKNCDISAQVLPEVGGLYHIEVIIPLNSFSSGDLERDHDVAKILKVSERPEMTFRTKAMNAEAWKKLLAENEFDIEGELTIGAKTYPVKLRSHFFALKEGGTEIEGQAKVRFSDFDISPPTVGAGLVVKAKPEFELHFHLLGQRILGADSIRPGA